MLAAVGVCLGDGDGVDVVVAGGGGLFWTRLRADFGFTLSIYYT
jgi:hypothetical protein